MTDIQKLQKLVSVNLPDFEVDVVYDFTKTAYLAFLSPIGSETDFKTYFLVSKDFKTCAIYSPMGNLREFTEGTTPDRLIFDKNDSGEDSELEHHGILGQRWGKLNGPPYPLGEKKHSSKEKRSAKLAGVKVGKSSKLGSIANVLKKSAKKAKEVYKVVDAKQKESALAAKKKADAKKRSMEAKKRAAAKAKEKAAKEAFEEAKLKAYNNGDKNWIVKNRDKLTNDEIKIMNERLAMIRSLDDQAAPLSKTERMLNTAFDRADRYSDWAQKGIKAYNLASDVVNSVSDTKLPKIRSYDERRRDEEAAKDRAERKRQRELERETREYDRKWREDERKYNRDRDAEKDKREIEKLAKDAAREDRKLRNEELKSLSALTKQMKDAGFQPDEVQQFMRDAGLDEYIRKTKKRS